MEISPISSLWQRAADLAATAHAGQVKEGGTPYVAHPVRVALILLIEFGCRDPEVAAAALLHDVLEKTSVTPHQIGELSPEIAGWVDILSKNRVPPGTTYWGRLRQSDWPARLIKIADALDHFDCPLQDLEHRIETGKMALSLTESPEEPIQRAKAALLSALETGEARLVQGR